MDLSRWSEVVWTDENCREVKRLACHESELVNVMDMPFPDGAVVREPVCKLISIGPNTKFHCRFPYRVGDTFIEHINQGYRECVVVAVDETTGNYLYEYDMPGGKTFLRNQNGKPVSKERIPRKFTES